MVKQHRGANFKAMVDRDECFCGGSYKGRGKCGNGQGCPRQQLGNGSWHVALPKLNDMKASEVAQRYPGLQLQKLQCHVAVNADRVYSRQEKTSRERREQRERWHVRRSERHTWRQVTSSSASAERALDDQLQDYMQQGDDEVVLPTRVKGESMQDDPKDDEMAGLEPESEDEESMAATVLSSDDSEASLYDLRGRIHDPEAEWSDGDESIVSGDNEDQEEERAKVMQWRMDQGMEDDKDFAFVYVSFEEAYAEQGRSVAMAWSRCRQRAQHSLSTDAAHVLSMKTLLPSAKVMKSCDNAKKEKGKHHNSNPWLVKKKMKDDPLRNPGQGTQPPECEADKERFKQLLIDIMEEGGGFKQDNSQALENEMQDSMERRAARLCKISEVPTLNRVTATADEIREWVKKRADDTTFANIQAVVLEEFVWKSASRTRVITALGWMVKHLRLSWPLDLIEKPVVGTCSKDALGIGAKQTLAAQPTMFTHLEDAMKEKCENDDPTWTALLGSFLQGSACLRLGHIIRRSVPVERYPGWVLFFCTRGKQKHNRQGFYWGVPSQTSSGWDWATPFLELYNAKRVSEKGKALMGAIFRADDYEHFTPRSVNVITQAAMQEAVENPEVLGTYSWRRYMPTIALAVGCSKEERLALGDWQDKELLRDVAPITLRYAEGKAGMSRSIKMKMSQVQTILRNNGTLRFDDLTDIDWKSIWADVDQEERAPLSTERIWRNADVVEQKREFVIKEPRINFMMPRMILRADDANTQIYLEPESRDGQRYCPLYQQGKCRMDEATGGQVKDEKGRICGCRLGQHRCAAAIKGGRTCHGTHAGKDCRIKRHWTPSHEDEEPPLKRAKREQKGEASARRSKSQQRSGSEQPDAKRTRIQSPAHKGTSSGAQEEQQRACPREQATAAVVDSSIMDKLMVDLMKNRASQRGHRLKPEMPTLIAKVCEEGGELWLGPLPTQDRLEAIESKANFSIQIGCFSKKPTEVFVDDADTSTRGVYMAGTEYYKFEMSHKSLRAPDFRKLRTALMTSLRQGDSAYIHCVSGLTRAPLGGGICASFLMNEPLDTSMKRVESLRNVKMSSANIEDGGTWMYKLVEEQCTVHAGSAFYLSGTVRPTATVIHAAVTAASTTHEDYPLCKWKKGTNAAAKMHNARISTPEEAKSFSSSFCKDCLAKLPASRRVHVRRVFDC